MSGGSSIDGSAPPPTTLLAGGCALLEQYYTHPTEYPLGTAKLTPSAKSVRRAFDAALVALKERDYGVSRKTVADAEARIWATGPGFEIYVQIDGDGDGCKIRIEINQAGREGTIWDLMKIIEMMPDE